MAYIILLCSIKMKRQLYQFNSLLFIMNITAYYFIKVWHWTGLFFCNLNAIVPWYCRCIIFSNPVITVIQLILISCIPVLLTSLKYSLTEKMMFSVLCNENWYFNSHFFYFHIFDLPVSRYFCIFSLLMDSVGKNWD